MSISNLSSDNGFQSVRPAFTRDEAGRRLAKVVERYQNAARPSAADAENVRRGLRLLLGSQSSLDAGEVANALLARLDALRTAPRSEHSEALRKKAFRLMEGREGQWRDKSLQTINSHPAPSIPPTQPPSIAPPASPPQIPGAPSSPTPVTLPLPAPAGPAGPASGVHLTSSGGVMLNDGNNTLVGLAINSSGIGVEGNNATSVGVLSVTDSTIQSRDYGFYIGGAEAVNLTRVTTMAAGGENPYGIRVGDSPMVRIVDSIIDNSASVPAATANGRMAKNSVRLAGVTQAGSGIFNSTVRGGQIMLGGGAADERQGWAAFGNFTISGGSFECTDPMATALQIYGRVGEAGPVVIENWNVTSEGSYFASIVGNATNITFRNVTFNGEPLSWEHFHNSGALQQYASQAGVNIRIES
jgi:hypothetical protein